MNSRASDMLRRQEANVKAALEAIVKHQDEKALNWAVNYASAGISMTGEELRVQCLYVLNNIANWRGGASGAVRKTLKEFTKNKEVK